MRRIAEQVEVVTGAGVDGCAPVSFVWRGRSYAVREVLGQWRQRRPWWRSVIEPEAGRVGAASWAGEAGHATPHDATPSDAMLALEERVWRVAAGVGRSASSGVYELGHAGTWRLLGIED